MTSTISASTSTSSADAPSSNLSAIVSELLGMMRKQTGKDGANWTAETTMEEAGIDSFDFVEMVFEVEERYGIDLNFNANAAEGLKTVGDVAALVQKRLQA